MPTGTHAGEVLRYLTAAGLALLALVIALDPDVGFAAPPAARLAFWAIQISIGLLVLQSVLYLLTRRMGASRVPSWVLVTGSGLLGSVVLAPVYWLIGEGMMEGWLGYPVVPDDDIEVGDRGFGHAILEEYQHIVAPTTTAWALICLPRLHWLVPPLLHVQLPAARLTCAAAAESVGGSGSQVLTPDPDPPTDPYLRGEAHCAESVRGPGVRSQREGTPAPAQPLRATWCERLPKEIGHEVIAVASELQYLRVWTPRGCALILGALADVEAEEAGNGLRVHRSWWVSCRHVVSVRRTATGAVCVMSDGRSVPVSRRRRAEVFARFGDVAQYRVPIASKNVADAELD